jgi:predicted AlkP superfamily phosphohydrolase/phosphomutase
LVRDFYCALDRAIGLLASHFGSDATYYVVSDHGMGPLEGLCGLNRFLADRGFIAFDRRRARQGAMKLSILRQVTRAAAQVGLLGPAMHLLARLRGPRAAEALRRDAFGFVSDAVDWEHTLAVAKSRSDYGIWVNLRGREPHGIVEPGEQYEKVRSALIEALQALRDPKSREMLVTGVWRKEEILEGLPVSEAPDVYLLLRDGAVGRGLSPTEPLFGNVSPSAGGHRLGGVLVTCGPDIKPGAEVDAHITDIAPTVLYTMGLPVPRHMEGKVLMGLVRDEFVAAHPIRKVERRGARRGAPSEGPPLAPADAAEIKYRLRDLGYL